MFSIIKTPSLNEIIRSRENSLKYKTINTDNNIIKSASGCQQRSSELWKYWRKCLYL